MHITLYGTGSCRPSSKTEGKPFRSYTGWGVEIGSDSLLFDIGEGLLNKMLQDGKDIAQKPTHLFISHFHPDHTSDIIPLMQARKVADRDLKNVKPIFIAGPVGLNNFMKDIFEGVKTWNSGNGDVSNLYELKETEGGSVFQTNDWRVTSSPIEHFEESVCYRLDVGKKSIVYSGDMAYDERICELGKNADVAILECSFPEAKGKHLGPEEIGKLTKIGNFKKVVLTHMFPECEGREEEIIAKIKSIADVEVIVGYDFLKLEV